MAKNKKSRRFDPSKVKRTYQQYTVEIATGRILSAKEADAIHFDPTKYKRCDGDVYTYDGRLATDKEIKRYKESRKGQFEAKKETSEFRKKVPRSIKLSEVRSKVGKGVFLNSSSKDLDWIKPWSARGGKKANFIYEKASYRGQSGQIVTTKEKWGIHINNNKGNACVLNGFNQMLEHLRIVKYDMVINAERFRILMGYCAKKVFKDSFANQRFYSKGSVKWQTLSPKTIKKRRKRRTWGKSGAILREYKDLVESIKIDHGSGEAGVTRIYTDIVPANAKHHKYKSLCYAGWHNEGEGTYGRSSTRYIQRQFMGYSTYLDPFADPFIKKMTKHYLFDAVFRTKMK